MACILRIFASRSNDTDIVPSEKLFNLSLKKKKVSFLTRDATLLYPTVFILLLTQLFVLAGPVFGEHVFPKTFTIKGTTAQIGNDMQAFTITKDGAIYVTLKSYTPGPLVPSDPVLAFGFTRLGCSFQYVSVVRDNPEIGKTYGPYFVKADTYHSYFYLNRGSSYDGSGTTYTLDIEFREQLVFNDPEPNNYYTEAKDIGEVSSNSYITGHIGYIGCNHHDTKDYLTFKVRKSESYSFYFTLDEIFQETYEDSLFLIRLESLTDGTKAIWTGPSSENFFGPVDLDSSQTYRFFIEASNYYERDAQYIKMNTKAGGYEIRLTAPDPFNIVKVTTNATVLLPGQNLFGKVLIKNNKNSSYLIKIRFVLSEWLEEDSVYDPSSLTEWFVFLDNLELKTVDFSLDKLIAPSKLTDIKNFPIHFKIRIDALLIEDENEIYGDSEFVWCRIIDHHDISSLLNLLLKKKK